MGSQEKVLVEPRALGNELHSDSRYDINTTGKNLCWQCNSHCWPKCFSAQSQYVSTLAKSEIVHLSSIFFLDKVFPPRQLSREETHLTHNQKQSQSKAHCCEENRPLAGLEHPQSCLLSLRHNIPGTVSPATHPWTSPRL